ncbi:C-type lectin [Trichostrongylus colubriformis]|uniref:C-type lectin n=1 Tax=Trichostrongylus colubriformis TaxID=6319 RepID=A0AAN8FD38_TRICO
MNAYGLCVTFVVAMLVEFFVWAQEPCTPWIYRIESHKCYRKYCDDRTPEDAQKVCEQQGGNLVTICDEAENDFVSMMGQVAMSKSEVNGRTWIGYRRNPNNKQEWQWRSGSPCNYTNWAPGEPNNAGGEDYAELYTFYFKFDRKTWNDDRSTSVLYYICERSTCLQEDVV